MAPSKIKDVTLKLTAGHGPGQTSVAYARTPKDVFLATAGADGKVFLRDALILEPQHVCKVDTPPATIIAVDPKSKHLAVGDDQYVKLHKLPSLAQERVACRFSLPLRALSFSHDGSRLAAAGDDSVIKLVEVKDGTVSRSLACGGYVLSLSWDPEGTYLAVVLRSGSLMLYDTTNGRVEKRLDLLCERVDYSSLRRHAPSWHPDGGTVLAVPVGTEGDVVLYERLSWEATGYLSGEHKEAVNVVAFSPNGLYAATAGQDRRVVVWDVGEAAAIATATCTEVMSGLVWRPDGNELALVGESGGVGIWSCPVPSRLPGPTVSAEELEGQQREQERLADLKREEKARGKAGRDSEVGDLVPPEGGEIREEVFEEVLVAEPEGTEDEAGHSGAATVAAMEGSEDVGVTGRGAGPTSSSGGASAGGNEDLEGAATSGLSGGGDAREGGGRLGRGIRGRGAAGAGGGGGPRATQTVRTVVRTIVAPPSGPAPQPPFQPGATPADSSGRPHFLCYNMLGSVSSRTVEDHHAVEVLFHDSSRFASRVPLLTDYYGFDRANLGEKGVLYSSPPVKGDAEAGAAGGEEGGSGGVPAMIMFRPFDPWAPNSDWTAPLPAGEEALCLATGQCFVAVATSRHLLRLFSLAGSQTGIIRLEGAPVALVGSGALLAVVWHSGPPNPHTKSQQLSMTLYDTTALGCVFSGPVPLTPGSVLTWLAFTEDHGLPAVADSAGAVSVRTPDFGGRWMPVFEPPADRRASEVLWPVGLTANQLFAIVCKVTEPRPQVSPRPFYTPMDLCPPVLTMDGGAPPELEGQALLLGLSNATLRARQEAAEMCGQLDLAAELSHLLLGGQAEQDRARLRAFEKLLRGERHGRALEVAAQLNMFKSVQGAQRLANHYQARGLAERIGAFMASRQALEAAAMPTPGHVAPSNGGGEQEAAPSGHLGRSYTPIPYGKRGPAVDMHPPAGAHEAVAGGDGHGPLGPADLNAGAAPGSSAGDAGVNGGGGLTPFANMVAKYGEPGSAGAVPSTGPKTGRGLPTPNTLLQAATAKPDTGGDSHKRKPVQTYNNPFARKAPKLAK